MPQSRLDNERRILEFLEKKQSATNTAIAKEFALDEKEVNEILHELQKNWLVQFQQDLHLSRGELIMAKITVKGTTELLSMKSGTRSGVSTGYDLARISRAIDFAVEAHKNQYRKRTKVPYLVHPLDVLSILLKSGASGDLAIAGVLHDVLEDTPRTKKEVQRNFGNGIGELVEGASESEEMTRGVSNEEKKRTWKLRKTQKIEKVMASGRDLRLLICADMLANIRDLLENQHSVGDRVWEKFNATRDDEEWYYRKIASALVSPGEEGSDISGASAYRELVRCIEQVFGQ